MIDNYTPNKLGVFSSLSYHKVECALFKVQQLNVMYYDGGMGKGNLLHENSDLGKWKYPKPNTTLEGTIERVCNS